MPHGSYGKEASLSRIAAALGVASLAALALAGWLNVYARAARDDERMMVAAFTIVFIAVLLCIAGLAGFVASALIRAFAALRAPGLSGEDRARHGQLLGRVACAALLALALAGWSYTFDARFLAAPLGALCALAFVCLLIGAAALRRPANP